VIIRYPKDPSKFFIKRLIAFPNEKIEIKNGKVTIFNESNPKGLKLSDAFVEHQKADNLYVELKNNEYFVMGDNRANSSDSRVWGSVPENFIIGVPLVRLLPLNKIGFNPGQFEIYEKR
jgi:signal peptidase I